MYSKPPIHCHHLEFLRSALSEELPDEPPRPLEQDGVPLSVSDDLLTSLASVSVSKDEDHAALRALTENGVSLGQVPDGSLLLETPDDALIAVRRVPIPSSQVAEGLPAWTRGLAEARVVGPVWDGSGREIWIHVFRRVRQVRFVRTPGGRPFLSVPSVQFINSIANASSTEHDLGAGSLWVATDLFDSAPVDSFCGLRIASGKLSFSKQVAVVGDEVVVPQDVTCGIDVVLDPPVGPSAGLGQRDPGEYVRAGQFQPPTGLKINIAPSGGTIRATSAAAMTVFGEQIAFAPAAEPARYLSGYNRLLVPMAIAESHFDASAANGPSVGFAGSAPILGGGLALSSAVINPAQLGEAGGVGALMLDLAAGLTARVRSEPEFDALGPAILMLDATRLAVTALVAENKGPPIAVDLGLKAAHGRAEINRLSAAPLRYFAEAQGRETVVYSADVDMRPDLPRDVAGDRVPLKMPGAMMVLSWTTSGRFMGVFGQVVNAARHRCFQIKNALCSANEPAFAVLLGELDQGRIVKGGLWALYPLNAIVPTLPDPYASNVPLHRTGKHRQTSVLVSRVTITDTAQDLEMLLSGPPLLPPLAKPADNPLTRIGIDAAGRGKTKAKGEHDLNWQGALGRALEFETLPKLMLLDISSAAGQLGVALRPDLRDKRASIAPPEKAPAEQGPGEQGPGEQGPGEPGPGEQGPVPHQPIGISDLSLEADSRYTVLLALPAVQWEPVVAMPPDPGDAVPFPDRVVFLNSGVPTVVDVPDEGRVPIAPLPVYDKIRNSPGRTAHSQEKARFTLPFGMIAQARLSAPTRARRGTRISEARPTGDGLTGAPQLDLSAEDATLAPGESPAMPGHVVQLPLALPANGLGSARSVLGDSVTIIFNSNLGAGSADALVPVTRIGLSGFGETVFSNWINPKNAVTQVDKVTFDVPVGRTAREVVQVRSILLPYGVPVVRTVTLQRKADAIVGRSDSGWVAAGDGDYDIAGSGVVTHPGVVSRITNVEDIRETGQRVTADGQEFIAVYFHGDLILEGRADPAPVKRHLGYVRLSASGPSFSPATYQDLIAQVGPMGGGVDATIHVGGGNHRMRIQRVGIGVSGTEFAMAAWGSPVFPGGGDWSVLATDDPVGEPKPVPEDTGLPLIRQGAAGTATSHPYRFAAPEDLLSATPGTDFGILHSMGMQRAFYRRPRIEPTDPNRIVSTERPVIADVFGLARATSVFPAQIDCIPFPNANYALEARADGSYRLDGPGQFPSGIGRRTISTVGTVIDAQDYSNSEITYELDTRDAVPWTFAVTEVQQISANSGMGDLVTTTVDVLSNGEQDPRFENTSVALGGPLQIVQDVLTLLEKLGLPNGLDARMENGLKLYIGGRFPLLNFDPITGLVSGGALQIPMVSPPPPTLIFSDTYFDVSAVYDGELKLKKTKVVFSGAPMIAIQSVPGLYAVAIIKLGISLYQEEGTIIELTFGFGFAWVWKIAKDMKVKAMFAIAFHLVFGDTLFGWGVGFIIKGSFSLFPLVSVTLRIEGLGVNLTHKKGLPEETVYVVNKLRVALDVTVCLLFSFSIDVETRNVGVMRGPLPIEDCPDVL